MQDIAVELARHDERIRDLERWQKVQNGRLGDIDKKLDALKTWLIGLLGGVVVSLLLLIVNLVVR